MPPITIEERIRLGSATEDDFKSLGVDRVAEIKSDSEHTHYRGSSHVAIKANPKDTSGRQVLRLIASTYDKDHYGDRIVVKGWDLGPYKNNGGVYLWCHNMGEVKMPIGQALKTWTGKIGTAMNGVKNFDFKAAGLDPTKSALMQDVEFFHPDDGPDDHFKFAQTVYLIMSGIGVRSGKGMMGSSVGFVPKEIKRVESKEEREKLDLGPWGVLHLRQVLLEDSATPTPANPFASVIGGKKSFKPFEKQVLEELDYIESEKMLPVSLLNDFRKRAVLGPVDAQEKLEARLRSRIFLTDDESVQAVPDGFDEVVISKDVADDEPEVESEDATVEDDDNASPPKVEATANEDGTFTLTVDETCRKALQVAYEGADNSLAALGAMLDAIDAKNTDPDIQSTTGVGTVTNDEIVERLDMIEARLTKLVALPADSPSSSESKADADQDTIPLDEIEALRAAISGKSLEDQNSALLNELRRKQ